MVGNRVADRARYFHLMPSYRLFDVAGGEIGFITDERDRIDLGDEIELHDGGSP